MHSTYAYRIPFMQMSRCSSRNLSCFLVGENRRSNIPVKSTDYTRGYFENLSRRGIELHVIILEWMSCDKQKCEGNLSSFWNLNTQWTGYFKKVYSSDFWVIIRIQSGKCLAIKEKRWKIVFNERNYREDELWKCFSTSACSKFFRQFLLKNQSRNSSHYSD